MKVEKLIPEVYYKQSRDFSYIGRLFEILFNYMKTGANCIQVEDASLNIDANILELFALTLGFESKHTYTTRDLIYIISSFSDLIRKKGTKEAINTAIQLLLNSQKIKADALSDFVGEIPITGDNEFTLNIKIPEQLSGTILLEDLFDYILPAGMLYRFTKVASSYSGEALVFENNSEENSMFNINEDTSQLLSDAAGGYVFILLTDTLPPDGWGDGTNFYQYDIVNDIFVKNSDSTPYTANNFYARQQNIDIGTINTGTVDDGSRLV